MTLINGTQEIETVLVSYRRYFSYLLLLLFLCFLFIASYAIYGGKHSHGINTHVVFSLAIFSKNKFVHENYETIRSTALVLLLISFLAMFFAFLKVGNSFNLGFFKINSSRVNINGRIFQWPEVSSLQFTINSPKVFGERSAKHGFNNWIEFVREGKSHRYEFYLKTTAMEDLLLRLIPEIRVKDGAARLIVKPKLNSPHSHASDPA